MFAILDFNAVSRRNKRGNFLLEYSQDFNLGTLALGENRISYFVAY
jgi:hypothetical protein